MHDDNASVYDGDDTVHVTTTTPRMYRMYRNTYAHTTTHTDDNDNTHGTYRNTYNANGCMHDGHNDTYDGHNDDDDTYDNHNGRGHVRQPQRVRRTTTTTHATDAAATKTRTTTCTADAYHGHDNDGVYDSTDTFGGGYDRYDHPP
ncbi:hypothetical protein CVT25_001001, partial [Psilocybe cyanescens]